MTTLRILWSEVSEMFRAEVGSAHALFYEVDTGEALDQMAADYNITLVSFQTRADDHGAVRKWAAQNGIEYVNTKG
jgi:hypothetical protein